jgi:hypothetical protein
MNAEAAFALFKFSTKNNKNSIVPMEINYFKAGVQAQLGSYTGV